jgi:signal transduction histidine kinase/ActR/RegA family two-component response regulator
MPTVPYPAFLRAAGYSWVQGYAGLFQAREGAGGAWARVKDTPAQGFSGLIGNDRELVSILSGPPGVNSGALSFDGRAWRRYPGEFSGAWFGEDSGRLFLRARNGIHVRTTFQSSTLEYIPLPAATPPHSLVEDANSALWIGCPDGVLHYLPDSKPPETSVRTPVTKVPQGSSLPVSFQGLHLFAPESNEAAFQFSWNIDGGRWESFRHLDGAPLDISSLAPGSHRLLVRARDSEGNIDPTPAILDFTVMPLPLQSRAWFPWALASIAALLLGLAWLGISRSRHLARGNAQLRREIGHRSRVEKALEEARAQLELRVAERTADLSRANDELKHEIHERHELEKLRTGLEEQLLQAQKMQAIGTLAGGIAHDFNNILAIITPCTRMALEECIANPEARENLQQVLAASERARRLVQQILTFSRRQPTHKVPVDLGEAVTDALKFMRAALSSGVRLEIDIEPGLPPILADVTQIQQVIINLCTNAQQALPEGRGTIGVTLRHGGSPELSHDTFLATKPHPHLTLLVSDDGVGMQPELLERIFDPFFTTKPTGKGTGLGLSVVDGIVKSHGGHILVSSTPGEGSTFAVSFPVHVPDPDAPAEVRTAQTPDLPNLALVLPPPATAHTVAPAERESDSATVPPPPAGTPPSPPRGTRILLVDDEPSVSRPLRIMLERAGFAVQVHNTPQAAHRAFIAAPDDYDLLLTDHSMAGMTGPDLARLLRNERPDLPVILVTGYGGAWTPGDAARIGIQKILTKPVDPAELIAEVRGAVSRSELSRGSGASAPSAS